jgi:hypothetical protein
MGISDHILLDHGEQIAEGRLTRCAAIRRSSAYLGTSST